MLNNKLRAKICIKRSSKQFKQFKYNFKYICIKEQRNIFYRIEANREIAHYK